MIVIDPLAAVVGWGSISTNAGARRLVEPLQDLAKDTGLAVLVVAHTVKSGVLQGSAGLPQALRTVYRVSRDKDNAAYRVLSLEKGNNVGQVDDVKYTIAEDASGAVRVVWLDRMTQRELLAEYPELEEADILACIAYGAEMSRERFVEIPVETQR